MHLAVKKGEKKKHIEEFNASKRGVIHKFLWTTMPSRNNEELTIVVYEQQNRETSEENFDINNNVSGHDHENPPIAESDCVDEQPLFPIDIYDPINWDNLEQSKGCISGKGTYKKTKPCIPFR
jgi:hypothetical protein